MQDINLSIFSTSNNTSTINVPIPTKDSTSSTSRMPQLFEPLEKAFTEILPQTAEENAVSKIRRILGTKAHDLSDEQIHCISTEFLFLINNWLDELEKDIFNGMTLKEVLNEK